MGPQSPLRLAAVVCIPAALAVGCGATSAPRPRPPATLTAAAVSLPPAPRHAIVTISNYGFHPETVAVQRGGTVTFTNRDQTAHTATSHRRGFDVTVQPSAHKTVTLSRSGTYTYWCQFHAFMHGVVVVR